MQYFKLFKNLLVELHLKQNHIIIMSHIMSYNVYYLCWGIRCNLVYIGVFFLVMIVFEPITSVYDDYSYHYVKTPIDFGVDVIQTQVPYLMSTPAKKIYCLLSVSLFFFPWSRPPFGECMWSLSLSLSFEIWVVCVCMGTYVCVCVCEHKFRVATNHGKFKVWLGTCV